MSEVQVSVCIPTRDHGRFVGEAIESALAQDVDGLEVLVHDDASDDETTRVVRGFRGDRRMRWLRHPRPVGVVENRNSCMQSARGRYVAWLDADDVYLPGALARRLAVLEADPGVALVHGAAEIGDVAGATRRPWRRPFDEDTVEPGTRAFGELILANEITTSTVVARRAAHAAAGPFVAVGPSSSDWDMWLRLALRGDVAYCAAPVARYRQHEATISGATAMSGARLDCDVRVVRRVLRGERSRVPDLRRVAQRARAALAAKALLHAGDLHTRGERAAATGHVALAGRLCPDVVATRAPLLMAATARGDDYRSYRMSGALITRLAARLEGSRFGAALARTTVADPDWDVALARIARVLREHTTSDAVVGTVTKWDPTLLHLSGRRGRQFPDRELLPGGYPPDSATAVAHLEGLRAEGLTHLVFPYASFWWLDHYDGLAESLREPVHADDECLIFDVRDAP